MHRKGNFPSRLTDRPVIITDHSLSIEHWGHCFKTTIHHSHCSSECTGFFPGEDANDTRIFLFSQPRREQSGEWHFQSFYSSRLTHSQSHRWMVHMHQTTLPKPIKSYAQAQIEIAHLITLISSSSTPNHQPDLNEKIVFENFASLHDADDGSLEIEFSILVDRRLSLLRFLRRKRKEANYLNGTKKTQF